MTAGQFFLGLVTIFVATFVYRWQKTIDRRSQLAAELRSTYASYLKAGNSLFQNVHSVRDRARSTEEQAKVDAAHSEMLYWLKTIEVFAPPGIVECCQVHQSALHNLVVHYLLEEDRYPNSSDQEQYMRGRRDQRIRYRNSYFEGIDKLTREMRSDVEGHGGFVPFTSKEQLKKIWKRT